MFFFLLQSAKRHSSLVSDMSIARSDDEWSCLERKQKKKRDATAKQIECKKQREKQNPCKCAYMK